MRKVLALVIVLLLLTAGISSFLKYKLNKDLSERIYTPTTPMPSPVPSQPITESKSHGSLFVPYWTLSDNLIDTNGFEQVIYFGIKPDNQGINRSEQEERLLEKFNDLLPTDTQRLLALRMTKSQENLRILSDELWQQKIIDQTIEVAQKHKMKGVVLDIEISAIPFDSLIQQINKFIRNFYVASKKNQLSFTLVLFGDSFYRARPYDLKSLAKNADAIMLMAYDLHKPGSNPGPNFPLIGREKFGYDFAQMIDDFLKFVPAQKITVIFGMFGYDWIVNEKEQATQAARALSLSQIKQKFIAKCDFPKCDAARNKEAAETQIFYTDNNGKNHVLWFEDMESVKRKQEYLKTRGITSFSYWAYSYF